MIAGRPESVTMTCPLLRSRTAVTVVVQDWPFRACTTMGSTDELRWQRGGIAEVDGAPLVIVQAVGPPARERGCSRLGGYGLLRYRR